MSAFNRGTSYQLSRRRRRLGALFHARRPSPRGSIDAPSCSSANASPFFETRSCTCQRIARPPPHREISDFLRFASSMTAKTSEFGETLLFNHCRRICFSLSCSFSRSSFRSSRLQSNVCGIEHAFFSICTSLEYKFYSR